MHVAKLTRSAHSLLHTILTLTRIAFHSTDFLPHKCHTIHKIDRILMLADDALKPIKTKQRVSNPLAEGQHAL